MKIEPEKHEFQGRDGKWCTFMNDAHYQNTVEDGSWPIRALYTEAQMRQLGEACAARCERTPKMQAYGNNRAVQDECAAEIRELIKELL